MRIWDQWLTVSCSEQLRLRSSFSLCSCFRALFNSVTWVTSARNLAISSRLVTACFWRFSLHSFSTLHPVTAVSLCIFSQLLSIKLLTRGEQRTSLWYSSWKLKIGDCRTMRLENERDKNYTWDINCECTGMVINFITMFVDQTILTG